MSDIQERTVVISNVNRSNLVEEGIYIVDKIRENVNTGGLECTLIEVQKHHSFTDNDKENFAVFNFDFLNHGYFPVRYFRRHPENQYVYELKKLFVKAVVGRFEEDDSKENTPSTPTVYEKQVGGDHYKHFPDGYQPIQIGMKLGLNPIEYSILKYLMRYKHKDSAKQDIKKLIHFAEMLLEEVE